MKQQEEQRLAREEFMKVKQRILERERIQKEEQEKMQKAENTRFLQELRLGLIG